MYAFEDLCQYPSSDKSKDAQSELTIEEPKEGYVRYMRLKAILEEKYEQRISHEQMGLIFSEVLKTMTHEKRVKKNYGESKNYWKKRINKK